MREKQVRETIGDKNWNKFIEWMQGQTCSAYPNGETNYYEHDVQAFIDKMQTGYDRQNNPLAWD